MTVRLLFANAPTIVQSSESTHASHVCMTNILPYKYLCGRSGFGGGVGVAGGIEPQAKIKTHRMSI